METDELWQLEKCDSGHSHKYETRVDAVMILEFMKTSVVICRLNEHFLTVPAQRTPYKVSLILRNPSPKLPLSHNSRCIQGWNICVILKTHKLLSQRKNVLSIKNNNFHSNNCKESKVRGKKHRNFIFYRAESTELAGACWKTVAYDVDNCVQPKNKRWLSLVSNGKNLCYCRSINLPGINK